MIRMWAAPRKDLPYIPWMIGGTCILILFLWAAIGYPIRRDAKRMEDRIREIDTLLAARAPGTDESIWRQLRRERGAHNRLIAEWHERRQQVRTPQMRDALSDMLSYSVEGRIDFKVALFDARQRLAWMARDHKVTLPLDLGIPDTIGTDEIAEIRLGQLAATVLLLEQFIHHGIPSVEDVRVLSPVMIPIQDTDYSTLIFYPIHVRLTAPYKRIADWLNTTSPDRTFFALHQLSMEAGEPEEDEQIHLIGIWSAVTYSVLAPQQNQNIDDMDNEEDDAWLDHY